MKKILIASTLLFVTTTVVLLYVLLFTGTELVKMPNDARITVKYAPDLHKLVLSEMRDYLEIMNEIQQGLVNDDPELITKAALRQGLESFERTPVRLLKLSPVPCKTMGFRGHEIFQAIADSASINYKPSTTIKQMAELTNNCIVCHRTYKLELVASDIDLLSHK